MLWPVINLCHQPLLICSKNWWNEYYARKDAFYIALNDDVSKDGVISELEKEGFWDVTNLRIEFVDPVEAHFRHTADNGDEGRSVDITSIVWVPKFFSKQAGSNE